MTEVPTEFPPEDGTPQRELGGDWVIRTIEEIREEALKHFGPRPLIALGNYIYTRHGDTLEGARKLIDILQRALFLHFKAGCSRSKVNQTRGGASLSATPTPRDMQ
uniref:Protein Vpr n=1 Tax=Human immunodeficiency virus 2 TaxID=11709 RepID=L8B313_9HIV2|nr:vpr protein [Human immunodeficiency virus 2]